MPQLIAPSHQYLSCASEAGSARYQLGFEPTSYDCSLTLVPSFMSCDLCVENEMHSSMLVICAIPLLQGWQKKLVSGGGSRNVSLAKGINYIAAKMSLQINSNAVNTSCTHFSILPRGSSNQQSVATAKTPWGNECLIWSALV